MVITNLRQAYKWNALYQTLIFKGNKIVKTIKRNGFPIAFIAKAIVLVVYDKTICKALHFDMDSYQIFLTTNK